MKLQTLGRWIVPATIVSMAVAAIVFLGVLELDEGDPAKIARIASKVPPVAEPAPAKPRARVEAPPPAPAPPVQVAPLPPGKAAITQPAGFRRPQPGAARQETEASRKAATLVVRLARAHDLGARLLVLDAELAKLTDQRAIIELEGLIDGVLPGRFAEAEQLRLAVLSRLGRFNDARVEHTPAGRLEPDIPRPQRLLALELLASRAHSVRDRIGAIAAKDHDSVVQKKAAWALQHGR